VAPKAEGAGLLFDHLVARASQPVGGIFDAEQPLPSQVTTKSNLVAALRNIGRFRPAQNLVDNVGGAPEQVR